MTETQGWSTGLPSLIPLLHTKPDKAISPLLIHAGGLSPNCPLIIHMLLEPLGLHARKLWWIASSEVAPFSCRSHTSLFHDIRQPERLQHIHYFFRRRQRDGDSGTSTRTYSLYEQSFKSSKSCCSFKVVPDLPAGRRFDSIITLA